MPALAPDFRLFRRTFRLLAPYRRSVVVGLVCVIASGLLTLWVPALLATAIDQVVGTGDDAAAAESTGKTPWPLWQLCTVILLAGLGEAGLRYIARRKLIDASRNVEESLKNRMMAHVGRLPVAWFDRARTGDLISRLTQDVELLRFTIGPTLLYGGSSLIIVPGGFIVMAMLSWKVFLVAGVAILVLLVGMSFVMPKLHEASKAVQESIAEISQRCAEDFSGIRVVMTFGRAAPEAAAMRELSGEYLGHNVELARARALLNLLIHLTREGVMLSVLAVGAWEAIHGRLTIGELFQFLTLIMVMVWPLLAMSWIISTFQRAVAAAERVEELFAVEPEEYTGTQPELSGRVEVRHLTFTYPGESRPALSDVSFALEPGQKLGLVGPVGSGKSTLLRLLLRLYEPPRGTIFVDGHDVLDLHPATLRETFAVAPQDPFLFSDTIRGNVAFGTDTDPDELDLAVHASALDQDIDSYPEGLESVVGERGLTLSGGQKQRVSLARALAADRAALVLDDTLSAVDHPTEARILERLQETRGGQTTIVASHRLSVVADADLILVLQRGRVLERGTQDQLLAAGGYYATAYTRMRQRDALEGQE